MKLARTKLKLRSSRSTKKQDEKGQKGSGAWGEGDRAVGATRARGRPVRAGRRGVKTMRMLKRGEAWLRCAGCVDVRRRNVVPAASCCALCCVATGSPRGKGSRDTNGSKARKQG
ncbi:hypothetical protein TEQG_08229 [Trichophyton equinum CBS 127.97]|uniref:Uncharacterized protein n=1 Tax=Trichophyton equinum (strain ATCC MYA-4606 / CBS 127.97) TaxID=559882 RepID=F2Q560_TRIEC|nr:hypothetical protein TEQG_08229 [Trichophyton equinum CBS 127.97]